eukprot:7435052-Alexandrium_andersonii.AAC.1
MCIRDRHLPRNGGHPEVGVHGLLAAVPVPTGRVPLRLYGGSRGGVWPVVGPSWRPPPRVGTRKRANADWSFSRCPECG